VNQQTNTLSHILRERGVQYVVDAEQRLVAVLLPMEEYEHYLDMLEDEMDSEDEELAAKLAQAAERPEDEDRLTFREHLHQRQATYAQVQR